MKVDLTEMKTEIVSEIVGILSNRLNPLFDDIGDNAPQVINDTVMSIMGQVIEHHAAALRLELSYFDSQMGLFKDSLVEHYGYNRDSMIGIVYGDNVGNNQ